MLFNLPKLYYWKFPFCFRFKFDSELWQNRPNWRRYFVKHIIDSNMAMGWSKEELIRTFGIGRPGDYFSITSYDVPPLFFSKHRSKLDFYFDEESGVITRVAFKYRRKYKRTKIYSD